MEILPQLLVNALITGSIYALASSGLSLSYGLLGILNFAHGHLMMAGAYLFLLFSVEQQLGYPVAIPATIIATMALSWVAFRLFVRPFLPYSNLLPFVATLSLGTILESVVSVYFGVNVRSLDPGVAIDSIAIGPVFITPVQIFIICSAITLLVAIAIVIHSTALGRRIRSLTQSRLGAESLGINSRRVQLGVFVFSSLLATFAGILVGLETNLQPTMGNSFTMKAFAAMILGGLGNLWGTVGGSFLLGLIENLTLGIEISGYSIPAGYKEAVAYGLILLMLLLRPQGLFARASRRA